MTLNKYVAGIAVAIGLMATGASASTLTLTGNVSCDITNFTTSTDCAGAFSGNDANLSLDGLFNTNGWTELAKVDGNSGTDGILTVATNGGSSGTWSVTDWGGATSVLGVLKGGPSFSAYLLDLSQMSGTWNTDGIEKGNGKPGPGLSHFTLYSTGTTTTPVPLPAAGWLLIAAVGGLGVAGRRRNAV